MKRTHVAAGTLTFLAVLVAGYLYQHTEAYVKGDSEDPHGLCMAALKGVQGRVLYEGDVDGYAYFQAGDILCSRYKVPTAKLRLPVTFPMGEGSPYPVTFDMIASARL